jgi:hypothetical protein
MVEEANPSRRPTVLKAAREEESMRTRTRLLARRIGPVVALFVIAQLPLLSGSPVLAGTTGSPLLAGITNGATCANTSIGTTALTDLGLGTYKGFQGGLYPDGRSVMPKAYQDIGVAEASKVQPLAGNGAPDPHGEIVLLSIGMSNAKLEFASLIQASGAAGTTKPNVTLVNGAQSGFDADEIAVRTSTYWSALLQILASQRVTADQVQVVWLKEAIGHENRPFPLDATALQSDLRAIVGILDFLFPNLRLVYLASRTYAGYATTTLNPEPFAYESGFAVKWLIRQDISSPEKEHPWLAWGPYLWTNGTVGRSDGFEWLCGDVASDGTHPSPAGSAKISQMLLSFFQTSPTTRGWFSSLVAPSPTPTRS